MSVADVSVVLVKILEYCIPAAFIINLSGWAVNVVIGAVTGKGVKL